jgi:cytosine/uracil/thiamine/allantoin permease
MTEHQDALPLRDVSGSPFYNADLAPTTPAQRTWGTWHLASLWVGMSVCIPTYMLGAGLIANGMSWREAMLTIALGNLIVLVPMILNGHAGTRYGIPFPVLLRSSFGLRGSNLPAMLRAAVACGWFGIQTWIGGQALYEMARIKWPDIGDATPLAMLGINSWQLVAFLVFWAVNIFFILRGTESIKRLEQAAAPILILLGVMLLWTMAGRAGGLGQALERSESFGRPSVSLERVTEHELEVRFAPLGEQGAPRATGVSFAESPAELEGAAVLPLPEVLRLGVGAVDTDLAGLLSRDPSAEDDTLVGEGLMAIAPGAQQLYFRFHGPRGASSVLERTVPAMGEAPRRGPGRMVLFFASLTAMVGFWATLSLNIPDFTRFARNQKTQLAGQALGLPTTMALYSFIGIAVTCAAVAAFDDILVVEDAPWNPVALLARHEFQSPLVLFISMLGLTVATLTTNIAANVVSPANDFSNLAPRLISFRMGGVLTGIIGILILPWKLIESTRGYIFTWLIGYGALLGPIGGIMIADYWVVRRRRLPLRGLYVPEGDPPTGFSLPALVALILGVAPNVPGFLAVAFPASFAASVPAAFQALYTYAWFVGFAISFAVYVALARRPLTGSVQEGDL